MKQRWQSHCLDLKTSLHALPKSFGTHLRTLEHGIMACEIAVKTMLLILELKEDQERRFECITICLIQAELMGRVGKLANADVPRRKALKLLENPISKFTGPFHIHALMRQFLLQVYLGFDSAAEASLKELEDLASIKQSERFESKLIKESLEKAKQLFLEQESLYKKT